MPIYELKCKQCEKTHIEKLSVKDKLPKVCGHCGGELRQVFSPPVVIYKGHGFHCTDYGNNGSKE